MNWIFSRGGKTPAEVRTNAMTFPQLCSCVWGLSVSNSSICTPNHTYHHHSWATWCWVPSLLVQICTFLHIPEENCSPPRSLKQKALEFMIFFSLPYLPGDHPGSIVLGLILLSKVTAVRIKEQDPQKWAQNLATRFLCPGSARDKCCMESHFAQWRGKSVLHAAGASPTGSLQNKQYWGWKNRALYTALAVHICHNLPNTHFY